jgi:hypothetical protein
MFSNKLCFACKVVLYRFGVDCAFIESVDFPKEVGILEQKKKLQVDDMNEALVYIAEKME